jgi:hypothetical protein
MKRGGPVDDAMNATDFQERIKTGFEQLLQQFRGDSLQPSGMSGQPLAVALPQSAPALHVRLHSAS